jgi:transposase InsO family protein
MDADLRQRVALFRYSLIAPLVTGTYTQATAREYLKEICARKHDTPQGISREYAPETLKGWLLMYRKYGIDGLFPKSRCDRGKPRKLSAEAKEFIVSCRINSPKRSAKSIYQELIAKGYVSFDGVSFSTIQRFLSGFKADVSNADTVERKAFEFEAPNDCWQPDISVGPYLTVDGKKHKTYIIAILDDASRLVVHCEAFFSDNLVSLLAALKKGIAKRGIPRKLFVDNAKVYKSDQLQFICAALGCVLCYARPYSPQSKGKIERWFKTLHEQWTNVVCWSKFHSLEEINASLIQYVEKEYNNRLHSAIGQKPIDKFLSQMDKIRLVWSVKELDHVFLYRAVRKVKNDATVSLNNTLFEVPMKYVGEKINLRYDPTSLDKVY